MIQLEMTNYSSADIGEVWNWKPSNPGKICFQFEFEISEARKEGGTFFQVVVATPEGIRDVIDNQRFELPDRNILIFDVYSWELLVQRIERIMKTCSRGRWDECMECLQRYFYWEYEDYRMEDR